jgi:nucleoside-diphosphate-sugar epimerase
MGWDVDVIKLFCFGLGFSAGALARDLLAQGWSVAGTARDPEKCEALKAQGIQAVVFDGVTAEKPLLKALDGTTHLVDSIPPSKDVACPPLQAVGEQIGTIESLDWVGYLSTTGVYGNHDGAWVDETTPLAPNLERSARRVAAEEAWLVMHERFGLPVHIFRLAGIYGPGRGVLEQVRRGRARRIVKPGQVFSRIHVDDIVATLRASMAQPYPGAVYNVCDDEPEEPAKVVEHACKLLGLTPPEPVAFEDADLSDMAASFYADNKRVRNGRIKTELGVKLTFPSYRDGMASDLKAKGG